MTMDRPPDAVLLVDGRAVAPAWRLESRRSRRRGLVGQTGLDGAAVLLRTRSVHTVGMRMAIDVAACRRDGTVVLIATLAPARLFVGRVSTCFVVEAPAGSFARWGLVVGATVAVRPRSGRRSRR